MLKLSLWFNYRDFEYDMYSLIRAFYPGSEVTTWAEGEEAPSDPMDGSVEVFYRPDSIRMKMSLNQNDCNKIEKEETAAIGCNEDRGARKNALKQMAYRILSELSGMQLPWGNLTGIRPTKIAMKLKEEGMSNPEIADYMRKTYYTGNKKTALAIATVNREKAILDEIPCDRGYSLYVGIPFCPSICLYCSFGSHPLDRFGKMIDAYLEALFKELAFISEKMKGYELHSIYVGGGTPTSLSALEMDALLSKIVSLFPLDHLREFTVEAGRPDTITEEKLRTIKKYPVDRISINPQTMNQNTLDLIGRKHTVQEVRACFALAREIGFSNINMDLIIGLPGEGEEEIAHTLEEIKKMDPDSLTIHALALKRATRLHLFKDAYADISFEASDRIMEMTEKAAASMGMGPYYLYRQKNIAGNFENVGYSKEGKAGIYNILIMEEKQTIMAAGSGASTKFVFDGGKRIERAENVKDLHNYIERIDEMLERKEKGINLYLNGDNAWEKNC